MAGVEYEDALALALKLSPQERLRLAARVVSSVENELSASEATSPGEWGADVVALLDQLDLSDWEQMDIPDVGEWVRRLRRQESERHEQDWKGDE